MKKNILLFILIITSLCSISQDFTGKIVYEIDYDLPEAMEPQRSMLPSEMITFIGKNHSRLVQNTPVGEQITIVNHKTNVTTIMMNLMGQKLAIEIKPEDTSPENEPSIEYSDESKEIAGYHCKKAIYTIKTKGQEDPLSMQVYYTPEISAQSNQQFKGLKGLPLEYSIETQGMIMNIKAISINKEECPKSLFEIPSEYEKMTMEEFQEMMGQ